MYTSGWANAVISRVIFNVNIIIVSFLSRVSAIAAVTTRIKMFFTKEKKKKNVWEKDDIIDVRVNPVTLALFIELRLLHRAST